MSRSIVGRLIVKDLYLYRWFIAIAIVAGTGSLVVAQFSTGDNVRTGVNTGFILFVTTMITFGIFVAMFGLLKERQDRSQLFVLSLPVSPAQYTASKISSALIAFLAPWLALTCGVIVLTSLTDSPAGSIPFFIVMMTFFLLNFCVLLAIIAITMSELWAVAGILVTNISVPLFLSRAGNLPGIAGHTRDATATWSPAVLALLAIELALILVCLALAFLVPSRKRDYI